MLWLTANADSVCIKQSLGWYNDDVEELHRRTDDKVSRSQSVGITHGNRPLTRAA